MLKQKRKSSQSQESGGRRKTRRKGEATSNPAEAVDWDGFSIPVVPEEKGATVEVPVESKQQVTDASSEKAKLYRPPTHDELSALKETQNLFKSNLMKLQITELLDEVKGKRKKKSQSALEELLHTLKTILTTLPPSKTVKLSEFETLLPKAVRYPLELRPTCTGKSSFQFHPPSLVKVVGGYLLGTTIATNRNIDLTLLIPESCIEARDHLNFRYFHKRALYVAVVAGHLRKKKSLFSDVKFAYDCRDPLLPIITLRPKDPLLTKYSIALHTSIPPNFFISDKLYPNRNNVRRKIMFDDDQETEGSLPPTPCYNTAVLLEMGARERHLHELYAASVECPAITDATLLFKVWVKQRDLHQGYGGFTGFHFAMLMTHLLWRKKLNHLMSCYQVFRVTLQYLATCDWSTNGLCMADREQYPSLPPVSLFHEHFPVVFLDSSGLLNLCASMSLLQFQQLRHQAALSHAHLNDHAQSGSGFEVTFMRRVPSVLQYDTLCSIQLSSAVVKGSAVMDTPTWEGALLDSAGWTEPRVLNRLVPVLVKGLGTRVKLIGQKPWADHNWSVSEAPPTLSDHVSLGLLYDTDHAHNVVEMGPPANSSEAREFRSFWGEVSELHRFPDGSINEAVMWQGQSASERRTVCGQIIKHVLHRHANIPSSSIAVMVSVTDPLLHHYTYQTSSTETPSDGGRSGSTGEEQSLQVIRVFVELSRQLRALRDLPLEVSTVQGAAAIFTHTEVFPPVPWNGKMAVELRATPDKTVQSHCFYPSCDPSTPQYVPCFQVVCQLEASGKWPDKLDAVAEIKTAFVIHISRLLRDQCHLVTAPSRQYLDVLKDGFVFRLHIFHPKETHLLRKELSAVKGPVAVDMEKKLIAMERDMVAKPLLTGTLSGVQQQYPSYGPGARLCKRWVAAHLLTNHITDEAVDLLVAHLYLHPAPYTPPCTPVCTLLRFLSLLTTFDWSNDPLIVNLNSDLSDADVTEIRSTFTSQRPQLPLVFIATPLNKSSSQWTQSGPSSPVMGRLLLLARESLSAITSQLENAAQQDQDFKQIFRSPLSDYNVLIHLHKRHVPRYSHAVDYSGPTSLTNPGGHTYKHLPVVDFDPVHLYLGDLKEAFSEFALFFHDKYGGSVIGVVWKPYSFVAQPFKLMTTHPRIKDHSDSSSKVVPDVSAIIADFKLMGTGLVKSIEILSSPPTTSS